MSLPWTKHLMQVISQARDVAAKSSTSEVTPEHILSGMLAVPTCLGGRVLQALNIEVNPKIDSNAMLESKTSEWAFDLRSQEILDNAHKQAEAFVDKELSTLHLLLAAIVSDDPLGESLKGQGLTEARALTEVLAFDFEKGDEPIFDPIFTRVLIARGIITEEQVAEAPVIENGTPVPMRNVLLDLGLPSETEITMAHAAKAGLQFIDLNRVPMDPEAIKSVPEHIVRRNLIYPVKRDGNKLMVAFNDVRTSMAGLDDIRLVSRCQITPVIASQSDIEKAIEKAYGKQSEDEP